MERINLVKLRIALATTSTKLQSATESVYRTLVESEQFLYKQPALEENHIYSLLDAVLISYTMDQRQFNGTVTPAIIIRHWLVLLRWLIWVGDDWKQNLEENIKLLRDHNNCNSAGYSVRWIAKVFQ